MSHYCKNCSLVIFADIRNKEANDKGFCSRVCERLFEQEKRLVLERAQREVDDAVARAEGKP